MPAPTAGSSDDGHTNTSSGRAVSAAVSAAVNAAQFAAPAQKERLIQEAAAKALAARTAAQRDGAAATSGSAALGDGLTAVAGGRDGTARGSAGAVGNNPRPAVSYTPPPWAAVPQGLPYSMEVLKNGTIVDNIDLAAKDHYKFGRTPDADVVLEHPSASRLHAVVQFKVGGDAFLWDPGSTHGTWVNKQRVEAAKYVPLRVGSVVRFGQSSRLYAFNGPQELLPEEGPTKEMRMQQRAMQEILARRSREAAVAEAQMQVALTSSAKGGGGVGWGMAEDAEEEVDEFGDIDWRQYQQTQGLNEKQQKMAHKIEGRMQKMANLQKEIDKIRAKETGMDELTAGQASTMVRNEREIDRLGAEVDDLEDALGESIRDGIKGRRLQQQGGAAAAKPRAGKKAGRRRDEDDEDDAGSASSDDDAFYDRTGAAGLAGIVGGGGRRKRARGAAPEQQAQDAAGLLGQKQALVAERDKLLAALAKEEEALAAAAGPQQHQGNSAADGGNGEGGAAVDALDAFMSGVETQLEKDKVGSLLKEVAQVEERIAQAERLLKLADPEGYFKPGTAAAEAATRRAAAALEHEKKRKLAEERRRKEREAAKAAEAAFVPEEEEEEEEEGEQQQRGKRPPPTTTAPGGGAPAADATLPQQQHAKPPAEHAVVQEPPKVVYGLEVRAPKPGGAKPSAASAAPAGVSLQRRAEVASRLDALKRDAQHKERHKDARSHAEAKVLEDLALLTGATRAKQQQQQEEEEPLPVKKGQQLQQQQSSDAEWKPPEGQTGDGRTSLNEKLGY